MATSKALGWCCRSTLVNAPYNSLPTILWSCFVLLIPCCLNGSEVKTNTAADALILREIGNRRAIDLALNSTTEAERHVSAQFLEWLLTDGHKQIHHAGLRLRHGVITGWLDLRNLEIPVEVRFEGCRFKAGVNLDGAHFKNDLSFEGSVFEGSLRAPSVKIDGSMLLSTRQVWPEERVSLSRRPREVFPVSILRTNENQEVWPVFGTNVTFITNQQVFRWAVRSTLRSARYDSNHFIATLQGTNLFLTQGNYAHLGSNSVTNLSVGPMAVPGWAPPLTPQPLPPIVIQDAWERALTEHRDFNDFIRPSDDALMNTPTDVRLSFVENNDGPVFALWWNVGESKSVKLYQETIFRGEVTLDGATIGGRLVAADVTFSRNLSCSGIRVGDTIWMENSRFNGQTSFGYAEVRHDCGLQYASFTSGTEINAYGLNVGGSLNLKWASFRSRANFSETRIGKDLRAEYVQFIHPEGVVKFRGLDVGGSVYLRRARFAGPADFILADIKGNFEAQGAIFDNTNSFEELERLTADTFTYNADFGSMQVGGFAIFGKVFFAGTVSFRHANFGNFYLDGTRWLVPKDWTNWVLRLEGMDFHTIRAIEENRFMHTKGQLADSKTNLMRIFGQYAPYSFDVYKKVEDYFRREGEPRLADDVFIAAKDRETELSEGLRRFGNKFLSATVRYGREPWRAFGLSCGIIVLFAFIYMTGMKDKDPGRNYPSPGRCFLFSLGVFLPFIQLPTTELLDYRTETEWFFRCVAALEKLIGAVLVPLWTIALAGLIK